MSKKKRGPKLQSPLVRDESITIRLNSKELECLNTFCYRYDQSMSEVIRNCLMIFSIIPES